MLCFDLHSDTLYEAYQKNVSPFSSTLLSAPLNQPSFPTHRTLAIWSEHTLSDDEAYHNFFRILSHYNAAQEREALSPFCRVLLSVEDARLLANDLTRLDTLYQNGIRILTLTWQGVSCIGGAWDTNQGLTPFGKQVVEKAISLGMVLDLSHASDITFYETLAICQAHQAAPIASHSNSRSLCQHNRCLTDDMFQTIKQLGGIVGISFVPYHLSNSGTASYETVIEHIKHFLSLGGEDSLAIGSDFDGVDQLPRGLDSIDRLPFFAEKLTQATSYTICEKIMWQNAANFMKQHAFIN